MITDGPAVTLRWLVGVACVIGGHAGGLITPTLGWTQAASSPDGGLSPEASLKSITLAPGFRIELFASEPLVADPVAIAWDERGRLWVAEMADYPTAGPGGRVRILEDIDHDGRADRGQVFADGLAYPASVLPHRQGVLVAAAPEILYLEDIDGDGRADVRRVVLTGFGLASTQLRVNGLMYGLDGRIYAANGRSGGKVRRAEDPPEQAVDIAHRDVSFDPRTYAPEAIAGASQFGHAFDAWGRRFLSWNTVHIRQAVLSPKDLERHPRLARTDTVATISDHGDSARIYPLVPPPRTFNAEPTDHFNASCGLTIEDGGVFPEAFAGSAFICEPLVGLVHRDILVAGPAPTLVARRGELASEFLASTDPWFHPVQARSGPDGALYIVDFYRELVEHPEYVRQEIRGQVNFTRGRGRGRIYRVVPTTRSTLAVEDLSRLGANELVARFDSPSARVRELSQRLLLERGGDEALNDLERLAVQASKPLARVWALWTLQALGKLELELLELALDDEHPRVVDNALRLSRKLSWRVWDGERRTRLFQAIVAARIDAAPDLSLTRLLAVGDFPPELSGSVLLAPSGLLDPWHQLARLSALQGLEAAFLLGSSTISFPGEPRRVDELFREVAQLLGQSLGQEASTGVINQVLARALELLRGEQPPRGLAIATGLLSGLRRSDAAAPSGLAWESLAKHIDSLARQAETSPPLRLQAIAFQAHADRDVAEPLLTGLLDPHQDLEVQVAAAQALGNRLEPEAAALLLERLPTATPAAMTTLRDALRKHLSRGRLSSPLRLEVEGALMPAHSHNSTQRATVVARYQKALPATGDAGKGALMFQAQCASCHRFGGQGVVVGPDLAATGGKSDDEILTALLDPNQAVVGGYGAVTLVLQSGEVLTGIVAGETDRSIALRFAAGREETVLRSQIATLESTGASLMPEGLESMMTPSDVADLIAYLRSATASR